MFNWNDIKNFDVKDVDLTKIDLTRFDLRNIELPKFELPELDLPKVDLPKVDLPDVDLPDLPAEFERVTGLARDAAYAGVGAAVITVQKMDEQGRELADQVAARVRKLVGTTA